MPIFLPILKLFQVETIRNTAAFMRLAKFQYDRVQMWANGAIEANMTPERGSTRKNIMKKNHKIKLKSSNQMPTATYTQKSR